MTGKLIATAVLAAANVAMGAMNKIEGPRLDSTKVSLAEYGTPLDDFYGIRRLEGRPIIWADDLREEKKKTKGKGGKTSEYKYYADFAVAVAGHEIEAIRRIWFDNHLVFQLGDAGPISVGSFFTQTLGQSGAGRVLKLAQGRNMRFYLGTDDQEPDPMIEAWFEDHPDFGVDCCSAMRGTAYIAFQNIPVEKFGNRIPTVTVEAVAVKEEAFLSDDEPGTPPGLGTLSNFVFSPDFTKFFVAGVTGPPTDFELWDVPTRTKLNGGTLTGGAFGAGSIGLDSNGNLYAGGSSLGIKYIYRYSPYGGSPTIVETTTNLQSGCFVLRDGAGNEYLGTAPSTGSVSYFGGLGSPAEFDAASAVAADTRIISYVEDGHGDIWGLVRGSGASTSTIYFHRFVDHSDRGVAATHSIAVAASSESALFAAHSLDAGVFLVYWGDDQLYIIDDTTFTITDTLAWGGFIFGNPARFLNHPPGDPSIWIGYKEVDIATGATIRTVDPSDWGAGATGAPVYDPISHALIAQGSGEVVWMYLDRIDSADGTLGAIVEAEAAKAGLTIDASALNQLVAGYSVTQAPVKDRIAPLFDLHDSILRPHGFDIVGIKQPTTTVGTILVEDFVREGDEPRYEIDEIQATDLPAIMEVKWADSTSDQQTNSVPIPRHLGTTDSSRVQPIDLSTYVDTPTGMVQKAERFLRAQWNRRATVKNAITSKYISAEPGDAYQLNLDGVVWTALLERITFSATSPRLQCEWRRTFASLNNLGSGTGVGMTGREPDAIIIPGPTKGFVFDIPLVEDSDNDANPQIYYAAGGYNIAWPGAAILEGDLDGDDYSEWKSVSSSGEAVWGFASDALPTANPNLWDRGNVLTVNVYGTLSSSTEAAINADPSINMFALRNPESGDIELCNFATATLTGTNGSANVYELTKLLRGRRGTEWAVDSHEIGDEFVLVSSLSPVSKGLSEVGTDLFYKAQTFGRDPEGAQVIQVDFEGATLKPYAPARIMWTSDGTDMFGEIIRRTRVGGAWTGGSAIPLSENSEAYEVDIMDGDDVLRTITVTGTNTFTYTAAMMSADGNTVAAPPSYNAYQISDAVGRGFALAA